MQKSAHCKRLRSKKGQFYFSGAGHHKTDAGPGSYHNVDDDDDDVDVDVDVDDDDDDVEREIFSKSEGEQMDWPSQGCHLICCPPHH